MIDFHCHLDLFPNPQQIAEQCKARGIYILSVTTTPSAWHGTYMLEQRGILTALGLHPQLAHERKTELCLFNELIQNTRYIGEIGLDGSPEFKIHWNDQLEVFRHILSSCCACGGRIMSIHSRRAARQVLDELSTYSGAGIPILHWFSGSFQDLECAVRRGCWFSVGPAMFSSDRGRALVSRMPRNRVLTESDGPFARIYENVVMPWDVTLAVKSLADIWLLEETEVSEILMENFINMTAQ